MIMLVVVVVFLMSMQRLFCLLYIVLHLPELAWWQLEVISNPVDGAVRISDDAVAIANDGITKFMQASLCGVIGALFYVSYVPERWMPGRLDYLAREKCCALACICCCPSS